MVIPTDAATREQLVWEALATIPDPEIPAISLVDLGVIGDVRVDDDGALARVELLPTFVGCPAIERDATADRRAAGRACHRGARRGRGELCDPVDERAHLGCRPRAAATQRFRTAGDDRRATASTSSPCCRSPSARTAGRATRRSTTRSARRSVVPSITAPIAVSRSSSSSASDSASDGPRIASGSRHNPYEQDR